MLDITSNQIKVKATGSSQNGSSAVITNQIDHSFSNLLRNIRKAFVSGSIVNTCAGCMAASPSTSYRISASDYCGNRSMGHYNCDGIILDTEGYDGFELNAFGVGWGYDYYDWYGHGRDPYYYWIYVGESDSITGPFPIIYQSDTQGYQLLPLTKRYLKVWATTSYSAPYSTPSVGISQRTTQELITITTKTPQGFPVSGATITVQDVLDSSIIATVGTNSQGVAQVYIDTIDHDTFKVWGAKTINKLISNITAKDISLLKEINIDT